MMRAMWVNALWVIALAGEGCGGCSKPPEAPSEPVSREQSTEAAGSFPDGFVWMGVDPASLDPAFIQDMAAWWVTVNLFEGLTAYPAGNGPMVPGVATLPADVSDDGLTWTFHLRQDAKWADGKPVTATDFAYAWRRAVDPATAGKNADEFRPLRNAPEILDGREKNLESLGVRAVDEHTLEIALRHPVPTLSMRLATPPFFPVRRDVVEAHGEQWTRPEHFVGNGPFVLESWAPRERLTLRKNPHYWDAASVALERSTMLHVEGDALGWKLYQDGTLHWLQTIPAEKVSDLVAAQHPELVLSPMLCSAGVQLNTRASPFDNPDVRRAFALALDREKLVKHVLRRPDRVSRSFIPLLMKDAVGYDGAEGLAFDPEAAREALAKAGYPGGSGFPKVTYLFNTYELNKTVGEFIQRNLREVLEVDIELENLEFRTYVPRLRSGQFAFARHSLCGQPDPAQWIDTFRTGNDSNTVGLSDPELDAIVTRLELSPSVPDQLGLAKEGEARILASHAIIPLYSPVRPYLVKPFVRGFEAQASDMHPLRYIRLAPARP